MIFKVLAYALLLGLSTQLFAHGGDDGPSSLESEFAKLSHIHFPFNFSTKEGVHFGYELAHSEAEEDHGSHGIDLNIHPVLFGGVDKIRNLICLEESGALQVKSCSESRPMLCLKVKSMTYLGIETEIHLSIPGSTAGIGVSYLKGKNNFSLRMLKYKNEVREPLRVPISEENLKAWRPGDQMAYFVKGTLVINVFAGMEPFFHFGPEYSHTGVYKFQAKRINEDKLQVNLTSLSNNAFGGEVNAVVLNIEGSISKGKSLSLNFEFNLRNENVYEALSELFSGKISSAQRLIGKYKDLANVKMDLDTKGSSVSGNFGIPLLFAAGGGFFNYSSKGEIVDIEEDGEVDEHQSFSTSRGQESFSRGLISKHFWQNSSVTTSVLREHEESAMNTAFYLLFSKDKMHVSRLDRKLSRVASQWGIEDLDKITLPAVNKGYLKLELLVQWKAEDILRLLNTDNLKKLNTHGLTHRKLLRIRNAIEGSYDKNDYSAVTAHINQFMKVFMGSQELFQSYCKVFTSPLIQVKLEGENIAKTTINF